jgi:two-component system, cell cycle sensor histidine kinase and response regulator CckA
MQGNRVEIDMLLTDVVMTGMSGRELAEALRSRNPDIKVVFQSGYTDDMVVRYGILHAEVAFLQKPFTIDTLAKRIRDLLDER